MRLLVHCAALSNKWNVDNIRNRWMLINNCLQTLFEVAMMLLSNVRLNNEVKDPSLGVWQNKPTSQKPCMSRGWWCSYHPTDKSCGVLVYSALLVANLFRYDCWGCVCYPGSLAKPAASWVESRMGSGLCRGPWGVMSWTASSWLHYVSTLV